MALAKRKKTEVEHLYCRPPFPSVAVIAKQIGMAPQSIFNQSVEDPEWYAEIKATRDAARLEWFAQQQAEAMAELHEMTAAALDVKREHLKHYFAMSVPMVAEKASDYVLDRVIGKPTERQDVNLTGTLNQNVNLTGFTDADLRSLISRTAPSGESGTGTT